MSGITVTAIHDVQVCRVSEQHLRDHLGEHKEVKKKEVRLRGRTRKEIGDNSLGRGLFKHLAFDGDIV